MSAVMNTTIDLEEGTHAYATQNIHELDTKDILILVLLAMILLVGVTGNSLVCYIFTKQAMRLSTMELLIVILAAADLFASFYNPLMFAYWTATLHKAWHFGQVMCNILPSLTRISVSLSFGIILIITLDRWIVICFPFKRNLKRYEVYLLVLASLVLSTIKELPYTIHQKINANSTCQVPDSNMPGFFYPSIIFRISSALFFIVVFSGTVFFIYRTLYDKEHVTTLKHQKHVKKTKKVILMLITMAVTFFVLVYPREILHISYILSWKIHPQGGIKYTKLFLDINTFLKLLQLLNSVCNVFIYSRLHGKFRRRSKKFFKQMFKGGSFDQTSFDRENGTFSEAGGFAYSFRYKSTIAYQSPVKFTITRMQKDKWIKRYSKIIFENLKGIESSRETIL